MNVTVRTRVWVRILIFFLLFALLGAGAHRWAYHHYANVAVWSGEGDDPRSYITVDGYVYRRVGIMGEGELTESLYPEEELLGEVATPLWAMGKPCLLHSVKGVTDHLRVTDEEGTVWLYELCGEVPPEGTDTSTGANAEIEAPFVPPVGDFYTNYYTHPSDVSITAAGQTKNLICIYVESLETTYATKAEGGNQPTYNYIQNLTALAKEHTSFTNKADGSLGGFRSLLVLAEDSEWGFSWGTGWTMASLMATSSGVPFAFPVSNNDMRKEATYASGMVTLGDILAERGYAQEFLCGSDVAFGGRKNYYLQHGNYRLYDLYTARTEGVVASDYHNGWWGFEDLYLYQIAKDEITRLAAGDQPFNFTMLTVDTHHNGGYLCSLCQDEYEGLTERHNVTAQAVTCADRQVAAFLEWCETQPWYEETVIVVSGDHPRMDPRLVSGVDYEDRTLYNCFINADLPTERGTVGREFTAMDMFPTTLAALGFTIEGDRLGLGTNLFSDRPTLCEEMGYDGFVEAASRYSAYYIQRLCPELASKVELVTETETETLPVTVTQP